MFTKDVHSCYIEKFVVETLNCAALDTGCTKNVCVKPWLNSYLDSLTPRDLLKVIGKKTLWHLFYGWGSTVSKLGPLRGGSLLFTTKFLEIPGTHFIDLGRMKG